MSSTASWLKTRMMVQTNSMPVNKSFILSHCHLSLKGPSHLNALLSPFSYQN